MAAKKQKPLAPYLSTQPEQPLNWDALDQYLNSPAPAAAPEPGGFARRVLGDTGVSLLKGAIGVPEAVVGMADLVTGGHAGRLAEQAGFRPKEAKQILDEYYSPEQRAANKAVQEADGFWNTVGAAVENPSTIIQGAVESAPSFLPAGAAARGLMKIAPKMSSAVAAGSGEGLVSAGQTAEQVRQETSDGLLTGQQAALVTGSGALTGLIGAVAGKVANKLGIGDVNQLVAGVRNAGPVAKKGVVRSILEGFATEGILQELPQSAQEQIAQNVALGKPWDEGVGNAAAMGALSGGLMGGVAAPFGHDAAGNPAPAPTPGDQIRAEKLPETGVLTKGINAGVEAAAQAADAGVALTPEQRAGAQAGMTEQLDQAKKKAQQEEAAAQSFDSMYPGAAAGEAPAAPSMREVAAPPTQDGDILTPQGTAFKSERVAQVAANRAGPGFGVVQVAPDAYVVRFQGGADESAAQFEDVPDFGQAQPEAPNQDGGVNAGPVAERPSVGGPADAGAAPGPGGVVRGITEQTAPSGVGTGPDARADAVGASGANDDALKGEDSPSARWTRSTQADRTAILSHAGWSFGARPSLSAQRMLTLPWDKMTAGQRKRLTESMGAVEAPAKPARKEWESFAPETGTKGIPRADMPQIKAEHRGAMVNFLNARGIAHESDTVAADSLKPTQAEYSPAKVEKAKAFTGGDRSILVSADGHVVDGHHQWLAKHQAGEPVNVIRLKAPIDELLPHVKAFPSAEASDGATPAPAAQPASAKRKVNRSVDVERDTMLQALTKLGGVSREELASEFGLRPEELGHRVKVGNLNGFPFRKNGGRSVDQSIEALKELGYFDGVPDDEMRRAFEAAIYEEIGGQGRLTMAGQAAEANRRGAEEAEQQAELDAENRAEDDAERAAIQAADEAFSQDEQAAITDDDLIHFNESPAGDMRSLMQALGFTEQEISDELAKEQGKPAQAGPGQTGQDAAGAPRAGGEGSGGQARPVPSGSAEEGLTPDFSLQSQTSEDLQDKADREESAAAAEAEAQRKQEEKAKADAQRDEFTLTGSDSQADVAAAGGQMSIDDAPAAAKSLTASLEQAIRAGNMPKDNPALRKLVEQFDGKQATPERMKQAQEALEGAIVQVARGVVAAKEGPRSTFDALLRLYESQPLLNVRTSTSIENQAYSTPAPLAFLASELAGIKPTTRTLEPTAGNGMLLIGVNPKNAIVNELNPDRAEALKAQGFKVTREDATEGFPEWTEAAAVITNPPFGPITNAAGDSIKVKVDGYTLGQIDHLIAARALATMNDDGRATLIIGANRVTGEQSANDRVFFNWLYGRYNVTSHFEVDGKLYQRQGAGWPVRVISINGRVESDQTAPMPESIKRAATWSEVYDHYEQSLDSARRAPVSGASAGGQSQQPGTGAKPVPGTAAGEAGRADQGRPDRSQAGDGNVSGAGAGAVVNRPAEPDAGVGERTGAQRPDASPAATPERAGPAGDRRTAKPARDSGTAGLANSENQFQATYVPRSGRRDEGVLIPVNMAGPTQDALNRLEDQVGDIDEFARAELGYKSVEALHEALMGLQVDSVASAIYQIKQGKGVIIADQTGIGKGRQAASVIRWAVKNGKIPVFVTVKPSLFTDMYGDLHDIGTDDVAPFILNVDESISSASGEKLFANRKGMHRRVIDKIAETGQLPQGSNALFMTYSQINVANAQRAAVLSLAQNAVFVLDESHNAGGDSSTGSFIRDSLGLASGVVYLSATYAKRPDNMPVYFKTDIGDATADDQALKDAMASGGLPLQTVVANNLVKAGQMFRRERSYDGVNIESRADTAHQAEHVTLSDKTTQALRAIVAADRIFHESYVKALQAELKKQGGAIEDVAGNQIEQSVDHTEFSSVVHNFVRQMLLGLKAQAAADEAIASLKRGEKPLIAVENTMGSFLNEYAEGNSIKQGDSLGSFDYRTVLSRALERSRYVRRVLPNGDKVKEYVPLGALDPLSREAYRAAQEVIDALEIKIPVSPIDWMRSEITKAGFTVAEITGRDLAVDYSNAAKPVLGQVDKREQADKVRTTRLFNSGKLDALILNVAGSTGISLHASEKFTDQRQRHMIVAQAAQDINIFMQMLGRIHRTGQVVLPKYTLLSADLPAEIRPTALLSGKMKSLNANTSSNTESATSVKAADMLNKYGDQVVAQYLADNPALAQSLGILVSEESGANDDVARTATGRLALQSVEIQRQFYAEVEEQYQALIDYLNKTNQNELEPRTFDFEAQEVKSATLFEGQNPESPFGEDATYGEYSVKAQGKAMAPAEINALVAENLGGKTTAQHNDALVETANEQFKAYQATLGGDEKQIAAARVVRENGARFIRDHKIGDLFRVEINGENYNAIVTNLRSTHKATGNPYSLSKIQVSIAVNGALRSVTVPATQFKKIEVSELRGYGSSVEQLFKAGPPNEREIAKIVTGNLLGAYGELGETRGAIINFTKADGTTEQGILLPKAFNFAKDARQDYRLRTGADALNFLSNSGNENIGKYGINSRDQIVRVLPSGRGGITIQVPKSKAKGGKYFLDAKLRAIVGDFTSIGNSMKATTDDAAKATEALDHLIKKQALYALPSMAKEAREIVGDKPADERPAMRRSAAPRVSVEQNSEGNPVFTGDAVRLEFPAVTQRVEVIETAGQQVLNYVVMPARGFEALGYVELLVENGKPVSLLDIEVAKKGRALGVGRDVVETILAANPTSELNISNIVPSARGFWEKMGIPAQNVEGSYDGTLTWQTYSEAQDAGRAGSPARASRAAGQGSNAGAEVGSRGAPSPTPGKSDEVARVEAAAERLTAKWANAPRVVAVESMSDPRIPQEVRDEDAKQRSGGSSGDPEGFYFKGVAYLNAKMLADDAAVRRVLFHEALGHFGLRKLYGKELQGILEQLVRARPAEVRVKAKEYGLDPSNNDDLIAAAEEVLAEMAQTRPELGFVRRAVAAVRNFLRRLGLNLRLSDDEIIKDWILPARRFVEGGGPGPKGGQRIEPKFSREPGGAPMFSRSPAEAVAKITPQLVKDMLAGGEFKQVSAWHKTVGSPYDLAQKSPEFRKVFDGAQAYINDVSFFANTAADAAPRVMPQLNELRDLTKALTLPEKDRKALAAPVFEGTLIWGRDGKGNLRKIEDMRADADALTSEEKARELFRSGYVSEDELKRWQASPLDIYDGAVRNRYEKHFLAEGVVFTAEELRKQFGLDDRQVELYQETRAAIDASLDAAMAGDAIRYLGQHAPEGAIGMARAGEYAELRKLLEAHLENLPEGALFDEIRAALPEKYERIDSLKSRGYAPLMRFGQYSVRVADADGGTQFFSLYESAADASKAARELAADPEFHGLPITKGMMSQEEFKLLKGLTPETLSLFASITGTDKDEAMQVWLKQATSNRSALRRLIHRQGIAGFSEDVTRVLSAFVTSNARSASQGLHFGEMQENVSAIRAGDVKDAAERLREYVQNPTEEAAGLRGFLFAHFLGGSLSSAAVNMTQPFLMTMPYLSRFVGIAKAGKLLAQGMKQLTGGVDGDLKDALALAEKEGIVSPQELHQLQAMAMGRGNLLGRAARLVGASEEISSKLDAAGKRALFIWGAPFAMAEQFNRRLTFIAAYQLAMDEGMAKPFDFAAKAVTDTQGIYNRANRPEWARGAIGATLFTFKQYTINYLEFTKRLWSAGAPGSEERAMGRRAALFGLALLLIAAGAQGLPGADDLDDLVDTIGQRMGHDTNSKRWKNQNLPAWLQYGFSAVPGFPLDVAGRLGLGNLIPGTGILRLDKNDKSGDVLEMAGAVGGVAKAAIAAADAGSLKPMLPTALANLVKAADMARTGAYRDGKGRTVVETDPVDAIVKGIGFQPAEVAASSREAGLQISRVTLARNTESAIVADWAQARFDGDQGAEEAARERLRDWNEKNPDSPIRISMKQIQRKVRDMHTTRAERIRKSTPKELRAGLT